MLGYGCRVEQTKTEYSLRGGGDVEFWEVTLFKAREPVFTKGIFAVALVAFVFGLYVSTYQMVVVRVDVAVFAVAGCNVREEVVNHSV